MIFRPALIALCASVLLACAAAPEYQRPALDLPLAWKLEAPWRLGQPNDLASKGDWWRVFGDATLDALQQQALRNSPTLALAQARLLQARATLAATSASALPQLGLGERVSRQKISANRPLSNYASCGHN